MLKTFLNKTMMVGALALALVACNKDEDEGIKTFSGLVDVTNSSLQLDKYNLILRFSTDNGATFVDYPLLKPGQKYLVKVFNPAAEWFVQDEYVTPDADLSFDWSQSNPKPNSGGTSDVAEFTAGKDNSVIVKVNNACSVDEANWAGTYSAVEDYGSSGTYGPYDVVLTQDPAKANRYYFDNFYDSGLDPYIDFNGTSATVSFPDQETGGEPIEASVGVYNPCTGELAIRLHFDGGTWHYRLAKQ